ncbi:MAG: hypothetical protein HFI17_08075 [Lachnospiraceae bacterium]|nr:hypothetical protein [Lachnospiraceae bacterium]MCI9600452.1 hypothetical protein [Lachnospiraceae bacterium]
MNIAMMCSMNTCTQTMKLQMKWQQRKSSGDYLTKGYSGTKESQKDQELQDPQSRLLESMKPDESASMRQQISTKMMAGKRLSSAEMEYLKENDPQTYQKARTIEMEREAYERRLKQCRTKEEVQRVKFSQAASSLATVKNVESNPSIPKGQKLALIMQELHKFNAMSDTDRAYMQSKDYQSLPTEAEKRKAEEELEKAEKAEMGIEDRTDDSAEETADSTNKEAVEEAKTESRAPEESAPTETELKAAKRAVAGQEKTRMEAEVTPEARKVRRAKAQAAYAQSSCTGISAGSPSISIDIKIM